MIRLNQSFGEHTLEELPETKDTIFRKNLIWLVFSLAHVLPDIIADRTCTAVHLQEVIVDVLASLSGISDMFHLYIYTVNA